MGRAIPDPEQDAIDVARDSEPSAILDVLGQIDAVFHAEWLNIALEPRVIVNVRRFGDPEFHRFLHEVVQAAGWEVVDATWVRDRLTLERVAEVPDGTCPWCDEPIESVSNHWDRPNWRCPRDA